MKRIFNFATRQVIGETGLYIDHDYVRMLFPIENVQRVYCSSLNLEFQEGKDYTYLPGTRNVVRTEHSAIPKLGGDWRSPDPATAKLFPDPQANAIGYDAKDGVSLLPFDNHFFFANNQIEVDYVAEIIDMPHGRFLTGRLPRFVKLLAEHKNVRISTLGDSITEGYNASKYVNIPPFQPSYQFLVGEALEERFGIKAEVINRGVAGMCSNYPLEHLDQWMDDRPDLMIIAYGMNDMCSVPVQKYIQNLNAIMAKAREAREDTEFLLMASMPGNPHWTCLKDADSYLFAAELRKFVLSQDEHVSFVDQNEWMNCFLSRKDYYDLAGNGVNHPNDFAHRIMAVNVLQALDPDGHWR